MNAFALYFPSQESSCQRGIQPEKIQWSLYAQRGLRDIKRYFSLWNKISPTILHGERIPTLFLFFEDYQLKD